jgi:hypothetical protein
MALGHLGLQSRLDQACCQLLEQAVLSDEVLRFFIASQQLIDQFVADGHGSSFWMFGSFLPFDRLHKMPYTLFCVGSNQASGLSSSMKSISTLRFPFTGRQPQRSTLMPFNEASTFPSSGRLEVPLHRQQQEAVQVE